MGNDRRTSRDGALPERVLVLSKALSDPTRCSILVQIRRSDGISVGELTDALGLHHSAVRAHLRVLTTAGLVERTLAPADGPGRPPQVFRAVPGALEQFAGPGPHEHLANLLLEIIVSGREPQETGQRVGAELAADDPTADPVARLMQLTRAVGFDPETPQRIGSGLEIVLRRCPFAPSVRRAQSVVCALHRGVVDGVLSGASDWGLRELVVADPDAGGCRLLLNQPA